MWDPHNDVGGSRCAAEALAVAATGTLDDVPLLLSPGQGSQSAGMLAPWLELPGALETVQRWSERTGLDLVALGTSASADEVRPTEVAQPLLTAVALLSGRALLGATAEGEGVPDLVWSLANKSLLYADSTAGATRYRFPETVRSFARRARGSRRQGTR